MVEKVELSKIFSPTSSTGRVRRVKPQNPDEDQNRFLRQLRKEGKKGEGEKQSRQSFDSSESKGRSEKKGLLAKEYSEKQDYLIRVEGEDSFHGGRIDILA